MDPACPACGGHGLHAPAALERAAGDLAAAAASAPPPRTELDQSHCTVDTAVRRVLALERAGALAGRRVLLLGDDDLLSLALAAAARSGSRLAGAIRELVVVDVDPAVLEHLRPRLRRAGFPARLVEHDLRLPLPAELERRFDTVFTDPPYTLAGAELFLSRAAAALGGAGGTVFLAFPPKPPAEALRLQAAITGMGFAIRAVRPGFNEYLQAGILGGASSLYELAAAGGVRPLVRGEERGPLYTGEGRRPRPYCCASCGAVQRVGRGARWATIQLLRADGCPECGAARFLPLARASGGAAASATSRRRRSLR